MNPNPFDVTPSSCACWLTSAMNPAHSGVDALVPPEFMAMPAPLDVV
jgi:hypothetical protein